MCWMKDVKNNSKKRLSPYFLEMVIINIACLLAAIAVLLLFLSVDVNKVLGISGHGNQTVLSEITGLWGSK
jgi:hypothetical protein